MAGAGGEVHVLRLAVSIIAGPPAKVLIRSPKLGAKEYSSKIRATLLAGFKVREEVGWNGIGGSSSDRVLFVGLGCVCCEIGVVYF